MTITLLYIRMNLLLITRLILFILGAILVIDGLVLFTLKKINFGTVVPFLIGLIFLLHACCWQRIGRLLDKSNKLKLAWRGLWGLFFVWLLSFCLFSLTLQRQIKSGNTDSDLALKAIIVLGAGVVNGQPTAALASRLDRAVPLIRANPSAIVITSGGIGFAKKTSEARIMANYLHKQHGIALRHILMEEKSTSTETNLSLSKPILAKNGIALDDKIALVTSDFHTVRAKAIATKQGYRQVITLAADTPLSIRFNAWFREYFAFISGWLLQEY